MALTRLQSIKRLILQKECVLPKHTKSKYGMTKSEEISRLILPQEIDLKQKHKKKFPNKPGKNYLVKEKALGLNPKTIRAISDITNIVRPLVKFEDIDFPM